MSLPIPYSKIVTESETLSSGSQGNITLKIKWCGIGPAPSSVQVIVHSHAEAWYTLGGVGNADNGIDSAVRFEIEPDGTTRMIDVGQKSEYISVNADGIAQKTLTTNASASVLCAIFAPRQHVYTTANSAWMDVAGRYSLVHLNGIQSRPKELNTNIVATFQWHTNPNHDLLTDGNIETFTYPDAAAEAIEPVFQTHSNDASWFVSHTTVKASRIGLGWIQGYEGPKLEQWLYTGEAPTDRDPLERYWWNGSGEQLPMMTAYVIEPYLDLMRDKHAAVQVSFMTTAVTYPEFHPSDVGRTLDVSLTYKWPVSWPTSAGTSYEEHTANRHVTYVEPRKVRYTSLELPNHTIKKVPMWIPSLSSYYVQASAVSGSGNSGTSYVMYASSPQIDYKAMVDNFGYWADLAGEVPLASEICACLGRAMSMADANLQQYTDWAERYNPDFTWWITPLGTSETQPPYFYNEMSTWSWQTYYRPKDKHQYIIYDKFGPSGFEGRFLEHKITETTLAEAYTVREFFKGVSGSGGGSTGGGAGNNT